MYIVHIEPPSKDLVNLFSKCNQVGALLIASYVDINSKGADKQCLTR
jgi:hypothetical protein